MEINNKEIFSIFKDSCIEAEKKYNQRPIIFTLNGFDMFITVHYEAIENKQRKTLLVMDTGSWKTRIAISIVDVLTKHNYVKNILFLADRKALVKQAKKNVNSLLPNITLCNLLDNKDNPESADIFDLEVVRIALRDLIKFKYKSNKVCKINSRLYSKKRYDRGK